jgi:hypothetical protein
MSNIKKILMITLLALFLVGCVSAIPTTGSAVMITSNSANIPVTGVTGNECWAEWGMSPGVPLYITTNETAVGGSATAYIVNSPLTGSTEFYARACDQTGCGNEISFTTLQITPMPTTTFGRGYTNISKSHWNITVISPSLLEAYTNIIPPAIFFGLFLGIVVLGMWRRNKTVRLVSIVFIILSPLIMSSDIGLMMGVPLAEQSIGQALLAAGIAGMLLSLVKK